MPDEQPELPVLDTLLRNAETARSSHLFMAVVPAFNAGNLSDAGLLFYLAKFRAQIELNAFPSSDTAGNDPALAFSALAEQLGPTINQAVFCNPQIFRLILDRVARWRPSIEEQFVPEWNYTHRADLADVYARNEAAVAAFMKGMGGLCSLLSAPAYLNQYMTMLRYNLHADPVPSEDEFNQAVAYLTAEETRRNIQGFFFTPAT